MLSRWTSPAVWLTTMVVCCSGVPVRAQDVLRQTVVVTAAATPVEFDTVTRDVAVITREQIAALPARSVADLLRLVASVDVRARGERGMQTDLSVRGAGFGQSLVLVDGVRINDAQSGHHNGDIPVPLEAIERIEVLHGAGSSLFGADAFAGTINIVTRRDLRPASGAVEAGSFDFVSGSGQWGGERRGIRELFSASADRSSGFMFERQFSSAGFTSRTELGSRSSLSVGYLWKDFGANGFYGAAPSHEWTNQTLIAVDRRFGRRSGWEFGGTASYRTHGDRFLFDVRRPGVSENVHRSHAVLGGVKATRTLSPATSVTLGAEAGGDWIRSTNLGNHSTDRVTGFGAWRQKISKGTEADASIRVDRYNEFGTSVSPSFGIGWWPSSSLRLRAASGRAFRVPTFTERYYSDPANLARPDVGPEASWSGEGGADLFVGDGWTIQTTVFGRADHDVIDWLRATPADRWRTYNVHRVKTKGIETSVRKSLPRNAFVQAGYTGLDLDAHTVSALCGAPLCLSKYVLDYAPDSFVAAAMVPLPGAVHVAPRVEYKHRRRNALTADSTIVDLRVSRRFYAYELRVEGTNLGNESYQEIAGVAMPGRAATVTLLVGGR